MKIKIKKTAFVPKKVMGRYRGASIRWTERGIIIKSNMEEENKCNEIREREKINYDLENQEMDVWIRCPWTEMQEIFFLETVVCTQEQN